VMLANGSVLSSSVVLGLGIPWSLFQDLREQIES
jgi:hypothetical protein